MVSWLLHSCTCPYSPIKLEVVIEALDSAPHAHVDIDLPGTHVNTTCVHNLLIDNTLLVSSQHEQKLSRAEVPTKLYQRWSTSPQTQVQPKEHACGRLVRNDTNSGHGHKFVQA